MIRREKPKSQKKKREVDDSTSEIVLVDINIKKKGPRKKETRLF